MDSNSNTFENIFSTPDTSNKLDIVLLLTNIAIEFKTLFLESNIERLSILLLK